jgi:hypothetical protein
MAFLGAQLTDFDGSGVFTSQILPTLTHDYLTGSVYSDEAGSLYVEQSMDRENWDVVNYSTNILFANVDSDLTKINSNDPITVTTHFAFNEQLILPWVRIRFETTSESDPTTFRLHARTSDSGVKY